MKNSISIVLIAFLPFLSATQISGVSEYVLEIPSLEQEYYKGLIRIDTTENKNLKEFWFVGEPTVFGLQSVIREAKRLLDLNYLTFSEPALDQSKLSDTINYSFPDQIFQQVENEGEFVRLLFLIPDYRLESDLNWIFQFYADKDELSIYIYRIEE